MATIPPAALLEQLYCEAVALSLLDEQQEQPVEELDEVEQIFDGLGSRFDVTREVSVDVDSDRLTFEYGVQAPLGEQFLFRKCKLNSNAKKTWALVHDTVHSVTSAA